MSITLRLRIVPPKGESYDHQLVGNSVVLGRSTNADLSITDVFLSRRHSRLFLRGEAWLIEDLGSRNGTLLNGEPVQQPTPVFPGDVLRLSGSTISLHDPNEPITEIEPPRLGRPIYRNATSLLDTQIRTDSSQVSDTSELRRFADRLKLLNEVHAALGGSMQLDELMEMILDRVFDHLQPEQGAVYLRRGGGELQTAAQRSLPGVASDRLLSRSLAREVDEKGQAALVLDIEHDERFSAAESIHGVGIRSLVAAPLLDSEGSLGMIVLSSKAADRKFSEGDMELLTSLASVAALRIRNVALTEDAVERKRLQKELALARRIQVALLPKSLPEIKGFEIHAGNLPSETVSGDYYVVLERTGGQCVAMVADVAGKGMAAALLTASLEALAAAPIEEGQEPGGLFDKLSQRLFQRTPPERYATAVMVTVDVESGDLTAANAGQIPALVIRADGQVEPLGPTGPPLGLLRDSTYGTRAQRLEPGDLLVMHTDGITETDDPDHNEYGLDRLTDLCRQHRDEPLRDIAQAVEDDLAAFAAGHPFADDRTLVLVRRERDLTPAS